MISISVRLFALFREQAGWSEKKMNLPDGSKLHELLTMLERDEGIQLSDRPVYAAVNHEYAAGDRELYDGDTVALFPPVSGGCAYTFCE